MARNSKAQDLQRQLLDLADDLRAVATWVDTEAELNNPRTLVRRFGGDTMKRVRQRVGLIKWLLGIANYRMRQTDIAK